MNHPLRAAAFLVLAGFWACARGERRQPPKAVEPPAEVLAPRPVLPPPAPPLPILAPLEALSFCLPRAMHASLALAPVPAGGESAAAKETRHKQQFEDYYESFLDAKEQRKYVACLEQNKTSKQYAGNYAEKHAEAEGWVARLEADVKRLEPLFPKDKRIVDVAEKFSDVDAKTGLRRVTVTLKDGTRTVFEHRFNKLH